MSDKLKEIKLLANNAMATGKGHVDLTTYALTWLIAQLEQSQEKCDKLAQKLALTESELKRIDVCYQDACEEIAVLESASQGGISDGKVL